MSSPKYLEYKDSGAPWLGCVPRHWAVQRFKWLIKRNDGGVWGNDPDGVDDTVVLRSTEQTVDGRWRIDEPAKRKLTEKERGSALLEKGDLLLTKSSGSALHIGKTTLVDECVADLRACYSNFMQRLRVEDLLCPKIAWYILNSGLARVQLDLLSNSTTGLANLNGTIIGELLVAVPPHEEQTAIVTFLDRETAKIDALIAEQEKLIALLAEKRQATISHAVTQGPDPSAQMKDSGVAWMGDVPSHWEVKRFSDACYSISTGPFGTTLGSDDYINGGVPVINPSHIVDNNIVPDDGVSVAKVTADKLSFWALRAGDIVIARRGELGRAAIVQEESDGWICGTGSLRVKPNNAVATAGFLHAILQSKYAREWLNQASVGSTMANLNEGILGNLPIALPRRVDEQRDLIETLSERLSAIRVITVLTEDSIALLRERRAALITAAVTGEIDVRGAVSQTEAESLKAIAA